MLGGETFMKRYRNEDAGQQEENQQPTAEDVITLLQEIKSDVKAIREKVEDKDDSKKEDNPQTQEAQNSFARLFNMQTK
ncbi:hypothetical protein, partial [Mycoplasmoides pneumoniae]